MANNRMYLVHDATGQKVSIAKFSSHGWQLYDRLADRLQQAFDAEHRETGWPSTGWHLEFEHHSKFDDPLRPSTSETWQDESGVWHEGTRPAVEPSR